MVQIIFYVGSFIFGILVGSFLNVFLLRGSTGRWKKGRSVCFSCGKELKFFDLIPIISYFLLLGRCRFCKSKVSFQYPLVELLMGILFFVSFYFAFNWTLFSLINVFFMWAIGATLILIVSYDIKHKIISEGPESILFFLTLLKIFTDFYFVRDEKSLFLSLISGFVASFPFFILWFLSKGKWIGFGDVKLAIPLGWIVGLNLVFPAIIFSYWIGGIFVILLFVSVNFLVRVCGLKHVEKYLFNRKTELPFAPFLVAGFLLAFLFKDFAYYLFPFLL